MRMLILVCALLASCRLPIFYSEWRSYDFPIRGVRMKILTVCAVSDCFSKVKRDGSTVFEDDTHRMPWYSIGIESQAFYGIFTCDKSSSESLLLWDKRTDALIPEGQVIDIVMGLRQRLGYEEYRVEPPYNWLNCICGGPESSHLGASKFRKSLTELGGASGIVKMP